MNKVIKAFTTISKLTITVISIAALLTTSVYAKNLQYGFAHRANDPGVIKSILDAGGNGIEIDLTFDKKRSAWLVFHSGDLPPTGQSRHATLDSWLDRLKQHLKTGRYDSSFATLWLDIKTPNMGNVSDVAKSVRERIPDDISVIYDLGALGNFTNSNSGYEKLRALGLRKQEGLGIWIEKKGEAQKFYNFAKCNDLQRTVVHHGHAVDISESLLQEINQSKFHMSGDLYRFKKVFTWTNAKTSTMAKYMDIKKKHHTDGQIVGAPTRQWYKHFGELQDFDNAIKKHKKNQKKAVRSDNEGFWVTEMQPADLLINNHSVFRVTRDAAIEGHNISQIRGSREDCQRACDRNKRCKSFDYWNEQSRCDLSDKSAKDVGGLKRDYPAGKFDHYVREYKVTKLAAIAGHNKEHLKKVGVAHCRDACNARAWCVSFDYNRHNNACDLSDKSSTQVGGLKNDYKCNPVDYYERTQ